MPQQQQQQQQQRVACIQKEVPAREESKAIWVQHSYHDRSQEPPPSHSLNPSEFKPSFPVKLHQILDKLEEDGYSNLISWQPHGRCFVIHQPREFTSTVLPVYFDGLSKLTSFQRQLNLYGFKRITQGRDKGGYYHECFLKSKVYLAYKIPRQKVKGTGVRGKPNPDQEPDLWDFPWVTSANENQEDKQKGEEESEKLPISSSCSSLLVDTLLCVPDKVFPSANNATKSIQELLFQRSQKQNVKLLESIKMEEPSLKPMHPGAPPLQNTSAFSPLPLPPRLSAPVLPITTMAGPATAHLPPFEADASVQGFSNWMSQPQQTDSSLILPQQGSNVDSVMSLEDYIYSLEEDLQVPHVSASSSSLVGKTVSAQAGVSGNTQGSQPMIDLSGLSDQQLQSLSMSIGRQVEAPPSTSLLAGNASFSTLNDPLLYFLDEARMSAPSMCEDDADASSSSARFPTIASTTSPVPL